MKIVPVVLTASMAVLTACTQTEERPAPTKMLSGSAFSADTVYGRVTAQNGAPRADVAIYLSRIEDGRLKFPDEIMAGKPVARSDSNGDYQVTGVAPGKYTIIYARDAKTFVTSPITVPLKSRNGMTVNW